MTTLIADCETDGLLPTMTRLHMLQVGDADGDDAVIYADLPREQVEDVRRRKLLKHPIRPLGEGLERLLAADRYVFHNGCGFDLDAINHFHPGTVVMPKMLDTLVLARLAQPDERDHTLRAWGRRIGVLKDDYRGSYQTVDDEFLTYSEQDVVVGRALFNKVKHVLEWGESAALEHAVARAIVLQERNGWTLDVKGAELLAADLRGQLEEIGKGLQDVFPPLERVTTIIPKVNNKARGYVKGVPFDKKRMEAFNPKSRHHCAERLKMAGWTPREINDDGTPKLDEKVLASLPYPEAKALIGYFKTNKMLAQLSDGKEGWLRHVQADGRVHGRINPNGAVTGRMSHSKPNMANVDKDRRMRGLWQPRAGWSLVGCDAEGLEARMLAHYLARWDDGAYGRMVLEGNSDDRTDVHSANLKACIKSGLVPMQAWSNDKHTTGKSFFKIARDCIKNLLYGMMYGAQDPKLGEMVVILLKAIGSRPSPMAARERGALFRRAIATSMVGLDLLTEAVKARAKTRGFLVGLDGRRLPVRSQHAALNTLLQGGGAIVMKKALALFLDRVAEEGLEHGVDFALVGNIHDEVQLEAKPDLADGLGRTLADAIRLAGEHFQLRCPLAGKHSVGASWADTH